MILIVLANVSSLAGNLVDFFVGLRYNEKSKIILFNLLSSSFSLIAMILLQSKAGAISVIVTMVRLATIYLKDKYKLKWVNPLILVFIALYGLTFLDNNVWVAFSIFVCNMCSFIPKWVSKDMQKIRAGALLANIAILWTNVVIKNYASLPFNIFAIVSISIQFVKWHGHKCLDAAVDEEDKNGCGVSARKQRAGDSE